MDSDTCSFLKQEVLLLKAEDDILPGYSRETAKANKQQLSNSCCKFISHACFTHLECSRIMHMIIYN